MSREGEGRDGMVWEGCRSVGEMGGKGWNGLGRVWKCRGKGREGMEWFGKGVEVSRNGIKVRGAHSTKLSACTAVQNLAFFLQDFNSCDLIS